MAGLGGGGGGRSYMKQSTQPFIISQISVLWFVGISNASCNLGSVQCVCNQLMMIHKY